ncbi:MAG: O-antigen ligase family protein [Crocinitomicaceae bacterium]|nr:O-antigen ligase family protein [Crocinitomicaceae bacterium]
MQTIRENVGALIASGLFILLSLIAIYFENWYIFLAPAVLFVVYLAIYNTKFVFLFLLFATPLSVNIEEYVDGFGLFLPTEPLLFGLMLLLLMYQLRTSIVPNYVFRNEIIWAIAIYLIWMFISACMSSHPMVSFKFLLAKLWFIIPMIGFGTLLFREIRYIRAFLWLFSIGMILVIIYTVTIHASYQFGEKESHWVMWPFFKDHTIYGAIVALIFPMLVSLYFFKKHSPLIQIVLLSMITINLIGLYFSYTRAAWLSIVAAGGVWFLIAFKIKFKYIALTTAIVGVVLFFSWTQIQFALEKNKEEHTTEDFGKRLESAANVTTDASNLERINRWSCAIAMFEERPFFGFGPGTYAFEYARFQEPENLTIISTNFGDGGNAHSEYLGPLAEMGVFGLLTTLLLIATIFYKSITLYNAWPEEDKETKIILLGMILALVTYFVHGILNNYLDTDKAAVPIFAMCACFIALEHKLKITQHNLNIHTK